MHNSKRYSWKACKLVHKKSKRNYPLSRWFHVIFDQPSRVLFLFFFTKIIFWSKHQQPQLRFRHYIYSGIQCSNMRYKCFNVLKGSSIGKHLEIDCNHIFNKFSFFQRQWLQFDLNRKTERLQFTLACVSIFISFDNLNVHDKKKARVTLSGRYRI